jgi:hypothetical protein
MLDEELKNSVTFTYRSYDSNGNLDAYVERSIHGENAESLATVLDTFRYFLHGMTFTYVENVAALDDNGEDIITANNIV